MPPKLFRNFTTHIQGFFDRATDKARKQASNLSQHLFGMSPRSLGQNLMVGADPTFGAATRGVQPENPSFPLQMLASVLAPGIPGGPIFKRAGDLLEGLKRLPTDDLLKVKEDAAKSMFQSVKESFKRERSLSGSFTMRRGDIELDVINDAADLELLRRARDQGDFQAVRFVNEHLLPVGSIQGAELTNYLSNWENGLIQTLETNDAFLGLLDEVGIQP